MDDHSRPFIKNRKDARIDSKPGYAGDYILRDTVFPGANLYWKIDDYVNDEENFVRLKDGSMGPMNRSQAYKIMVQEFFDRRK